MVNLAFADLFTVAKGQINHRLQLDRVDIAMIANSSRSLRKNASARESRWSRLEVSSWIYEWTENNHVFRSQVLGMLSSVHRIITALEMREALSESVGRTARFFSFIWSFWTLYHACFTPLAARRTCRDSSVGLQQKYLKTSRWYAG